LSRQSSPVSELSGPQLQQGLEAVQLQAEWIAVADTLPIIVFTLRPEGMIEFVNSRWYELTGLGEDAVLEEAWMSTAHPDDVEATVAVIQEAVIASAAFSLEVRARTANGSYRWLRVQAAPLQLPGGNIVRWFGVGIDIDDVKRMEEELELRRRRDRHIAATFQRASLPSLLPQVSGLRFDAVYVPAGEEAEVGGDWYDTIELDDGSMVISVGDVSGKGLDAAIVMNKVRHAMGVVPLYERDPGKILDAADWFFRKRYPDAIVTAFVAVISPDRRNIRYANAGHLYPLLRRHGEVIELRSSGLPLGVRHLSTPEPSCEFEIESGDVLVLYTDGLTEWSHDWDEGERALHAIVRSDAIAHTPIPARLLASACTSQPFRDDIAILTVSFKDTSPWSFQTANAHEAMSARKEVIGYLRRHIGDPSIITSAEVVFGELIGNVVRHAPGPVEIEVECKEHAIIMHVIDSGPEFTLTTDLPIDVLSESGRGIPLIRTMSDDLHLERISEYGNHIRATIRI
jgi:PAS domain S-box-containing protein